MVEGGSIIGTVLTVMLVILAYAIHWVVTGTFKIAWSLDTWWTRGALLGWVLLCIIFMVYQD